MDRIAEIAKAREVDTRIAALWSSYYDEMDKINSLYRTIDSRSKTISYSRKMGRNGLADELQIQTDRDKVAIAQLEQSARVFSDQAQAIDKAEYTGWSRFYLVKHIHSSTTCSSFRPTTRIGWLPKVSGLTEVEAVGEYGETLCTICFSSAPTELTTKKADPSLCSGSGKHYDAEHKTGREHAYSSPAGYCPDCGRWNTVTKTGAMRKHKVDETRRHW